MNDPKHIRDQVKLPVKVAFQVVLQGMRIRLGRSLVTIMGVVLGIAFLMSILTSQALKRGVQSEQAARLEVQRMENFLKAEVGPPAGKSLDVVQTGTLSPMEKRFLRSLVQKGVQAWYWHRLDERSRADASVVAAIAGDSLHETSIEDIATRKGPVLLMGNGGVPAAAWDRLSQVAVTQDIPDRQAPAGVTVVKLARQLRPEEVARLAAAKRAARFRNVWIVLISLLVTVIGISNAMLMSVTERFREIGTMKCLGALSAFIRQVFLFESCLIGAVGGLLGSLCGAVFSVIVYAFTFGPGLVATTVIESAGGLCLYVLLAFAAGVGLSIAAALYPAAVASRMVPANALRSNI